MPRWLVRSTLAVAHFRLASTQPGAPASCSPAGAPAAQIIHSYTLLQDKEALSETVANVRWLIAAGIRDFQAMLEELHKLQSDLPRDTPAPDEPTHDD